MGLVEDEIDDLIYLARTGDNAELTGFLQELTAREDTTPAKILTWARGDNLSTCLHMAAANGHASKSIRPRVLALPILEARGRDK